MKEAANSGVVSRACAPTPQILRSPGLAFALARAESELPRTEMPSHGRVEMASFSALGSNVANL